MSSAQPAVKPIHKEDLIRELEELGVRKGDLLNLKVSLNSIGYVVGGAKAMIDALLEVVGPQGTIVSEAFVNVYPLPLSRENALRISDRFTQSYAGALANAMIFHPEAHRSTHPVQSFVAIGHRARELTAAHTPDSYAYDVLRVMAQSGGGRNLKIGTDEKVPGVGTTHVAVGLLGFHQARARVGVNYFDYRTGEVKTFERNWAGGCGYGFNNFIPLYREKGAILSEGRIGRAPSKITDMRRTLEIELEKLEQDKSFFLCHDLACRDCRLGWDFSTGSPLSVRLHQARKTLRRLWKRGLGRTLGDIAGALSG